MLVGAVLGKVCSAHDRPPADVSRGHWEPQVHAQWPPYLVAEYEEWEPHCVELQRTYTSTGAVPLYLKKRWVPAQPSGHLPMLTRQKVCEALHGRTLGLIGDSTMVQFFHVIEGWTTGHVRGDNSDQTLSICGDNSTRVIFSRRDYFAADTLAEIARQVDVLVINWGAHYVDDESQRRNMAQMSAILGDWQHPRQNIFWRSTFVSHDKCSDDATDETLATPIDWHTADILRQDRELNWPAMRQLGARVLHIERLTVIRPDGHRIVGHNNASDCLHYCEPGIPDVWLNLFIALLDGCLGDMVNASLSI